MKRVKEAFIKVKPTLTKIVKYSIITVIIVASFFVGKFVENYKNKKSDKETSEIVKIRKDEVNIAIDETNNLIIFDNHSAEYVIYEDSIGHTIFKLYARNIWSQHAPE